MIFSWIFIIDMGLISSALLLGTFLRYKIDFFKRYMIPNSIIGGFILLPLYNYVLPLIGITSSELGVLAYHLLSISFIAVTLGGQQKKREGKVKSVFATSIVIISLMIIQALVGLVLTFVLIDTVRPDLFHSFGYLLPLGFSQGPGQAFAIGESWKIFGVEEAGNVGLTFAAVGFILCSFGGMYLINSGVKKGWISKEHLNKLKEGNNSSGIVSKTAHKHIGAKLTTQSEAIDSMTLHLALVIGTYLLSFLLLKFIGFVLGLLGPLGTELAHNFWGINFVFAALCGIIVKKIIQLFKIEYIVDSATMHRLSGVSIDVMVTSAIAAISLVVVMKYWFPILVIALLGGIITIYLVPWLCSRLFTDHPFIRMILLFGVSTGTLSTGLALLRVVDPNFETPVAQEYSYASGLTFFMFIPFILTINFPSKFFATGDPRWIYMSLGIILAYFLFIVLSIFSISGRKLLNNKRLIWNPIHI